MTKNFDKPYTVQASAPAKIILSGEHAILYNGIGVAAAVNYCATTKISADVTTQEDYKRKFSQKLLSIRLEDMKTSISGTFSMFSRVKNRLVHSYKKFLTGKKSICTLLSHPGELFQFAMGSLIEACYLELKENLNIHLSSSIPIGCGMGSSAATIVSFIQAVVRYFDISKGNEWLEKMVLEIERLQHGRSSGIDTFVSLHGGAVMYEIGKLPTLFDRESSMFLQSLPFWMVYTGKPESSTGECVEYVRRSKYGSSRNPIWTDFHHIALSVIGAIKNRDMYELMRLITSNHTLLDKLGVVPQKVQSFVSKAEKLGIHLKTTGAGAIRGLTGGVLLGLGEMPPKSLLKEYGYLAANPLEVAVFSGDIL